MLNKITYREVALMFGASAALLNFPVIASALVVAYLILAFLS